MAFLIVIGFIFVVHKLAEKGQKIKSSSVSRLEMVLDFSESIKDMAPCGELLCLMTEGGKDGSRLLIVNPEIGKITNIITFKEKEN